MFEYLVIEIAAQTVTAQKKAVIREHIDVEGVDLNALVDTYGSGHSIFVRTIKGITRLEAASLNQFVKQRVIFGDLMNARSSNQVDPAIAYMADKSAVSGHEQ